MVKKPTYQELELKIKVIEKKLRQHKKKDEEALHREKAYLEQLFENTQEGIAMSDLDHKLLRINSEFTRIFGYTKEEAVGQVIDDLVAPLDQYEEAKAITIRAAQDEKVAFEGLRRRKDGNLINVSVLATPIFIDKKQVGFYGIYRDITIRKKAEEALHNAHEELETRVIERTDELARTNIDLQSEIKVRQQTEKELKKAKETAEAASRSKSDFLATMSHEIRTPMNAVIGMTGLMLDTPLNAEQRDYAETVRSSADSLLQIINDILDFSKIEAGKLEMEVIEFDLRQAVEEISDMMAGRAHKRDLEFACMINPEVPAYLLGDPGRLKQVLINFINNAIKFTEEGEIVVRVALVKETETHVRIRFEVTDTGIGIPKSRQNRLFKLFSQVDTSTTRKYGGTGLGLAISKQLVEKMEGKVGFNSQEEEGSTFWFTAEFEKGTMRERKSLVPVNLKEKYLLVVDDNKTNREIICSYLKSWKCRYEAASSGQEALHLMFKTAERGRPYDLVISDHMMPGMDGEALGKAIKSTPQLKNTPLVMLTSRGMRGDAAKVREIGFSAYLTKPVKQSHLLECLMTVLGDEPHRKKRARKSVFVTRHTISEEKKRQIRILIAEDNIVNQKLALRLVEKFGYKADAVADGKEAVKALEMAPYHMVLMDVQMPEMDGLDATRVIRNSKSKVLNHAIPVIAMTAHALKGDRERCLEAGMNDYVSKPVHPEQLLQAIEKFIKDAAQ